jgi:hypothetical protein
MKDERVTVGVKRRTCTIHQRDFSTVRRKGAVPVVVSPVGRNGGILYIILPSLA